MNGGYLNARQAAAYVGYEPAAERNAGGHRNPARSDPAMRAFYEFIRRHRVRKWHRGRVLLFRPLDLDRAIGRLTEEEQLRRQERLDRMSALALRHAHAEQGVH